MRVINYVIFIIFIIFINSLLLDKKIKKLKNIESFNTILKANVRQTRDLKNLSDNKKKLEKNLVNEEIAQKIGFSSLIEYITGANKRKEDNKKSIIENIKKNNPLNNFEQIQDLKCKNIQIDIPDTIDSKKGREDLILKTCAKACHKNKECLSFDYKNRKCRLSSWCSKDTAIKKRGSIIYRDKTKPIPEITKFNIYPKKKMYGPCKNSKIGGYESKSSLIKCSDKCGKNNKCISFDLTGNNKDICTIYRKCHNMHMTNDRKSFSGVLINSAVHSIPSRIVSTKRTRPN